MTLVDENPPTTYSSSPPSTPPPPPVGGGGGLVGAFGRGGEQGGPELHKNEKCRDTSREKLILFS